MTCEQPVSSGLAAQAAVAQASDATAPIVRADLRRWPSQWVRVEARMQAWRQAETPCVHAEQVPLILLHGIGSGALSWAGLMQALLGGRKVLAWDAPGYGDSDPLVLGKPHPTQLGTAYAAALWSWLDALNIRRCVLVGHSLGAMTAMAAAAAQPDRVQSMVLASPALGYGDRPPEVADAVLRDRIALMDRLGAQGMADERAPRLCTPAASSDTLDRVRWSMSRISQLGYRHAATWLAQGSLTAELARVRASRPDLPVSVMCGTDDVITPWAQSVAWARAQGLRCAPVAGAAHACYVEHVQAFEAVLQASLLANGVHCHD